MRTRMLWAALTVGISGALVVASPAPPVHAAAFPPSATAEADLFTRINQERTSRGIPALARVSALDSAAVTWSAHMAAGGCGAANLCHRLDFLQLANSVFPNTWLKVGENVGRVPEGGTLASLHDAFMASSGHARNALDPSFNRLGLGVAFAADGTLFVTYDFFSVLASPLTSPLSPEPSSSGLPVAPAEASNEDTLLLWINELRADNGLAPLRRHPVLDREASFFSAQLAEGTACRPDVVLCHRRDLRYVARTALGRVRWWSENVGYRTPANLESQFMGFVVSKPHLKNMLNKRINFVGIGYSIDPTTGRGFTVLDFAAARYPDRLVPKGGSECGWVPSSLRKGSRRAPYVRTLQCALQAAGVYDGPIDGVYDDDVVDAVKLLEARNGVRRPRGKATYSRRRWLGVV